MELFAEDFEQSIRRRAPNGHGLPVELEADNLLYSHYDYLLRTRASRLEFKGVSNA